MTIDHTRISRLGGMAVAKFGAKHQVDRLMEECAELIVAIMHFRRGHCSIQDVISEVADVIITSAQFEHITPALVERAVAEKLDRLAGIVDAPETGGEQ
jgi:NTP pyrophosphatase (non-canonical NTP hydrolase)